jgi:hypothetical protein
MNPGLLGALAQEHTREFRREAARHGTRVSAPASARAPRPAHRSLRTWAGFALVEAGLHLLATPAAPDPRR